MVKAIPEGFQSVSVHLVVQNALSAIDFYSQAFGAELKCKLMMPDGKKIAHAELKIGNCTVMLGEEAPDWGALSPKTIGGTPVNIHLYVDNADATFQQAIEAGATALMPVSEAFWGDRYGKLKDPYGHTWSVATHVKDMTQAEVEAAMLSSGGCAEAAPAAV